jgi:BON domain
MSCTGIPQVKPTDVGVEINDGIVTLTGTVSDYKKRRSAVEAALRVHRSQVKDLLAVSKGKSDPERSQEHQTTRSGYAIGTVGRQFPNVRHGEMECSLLCGLRSGPYMAGKTVLTWFSFP